MVENHIERLASRILRQINCSFFNLGQDVFSDEMLMNELPRDKVESLSMVSAAVLRSGFKFEAWVQHDIGKISLLKYRISK